MTIYKDKLYGWGVGRVQMPRTVILHHIPWRDSLLWSVLLMVICALSAILIPEFKKPEPVTIIAKIMEEKKKPKKKIVKRVVKKKPKRIARTRVKPAPKPKPKKVVKQKTLPEPVTKIKARPKKIKYTPRKNRVAMPSKTVQPKPAPEVKIDAPKRKMVYAAKRVNVKRTTKTPKVRSSFQREDSIDFSTQRKSSKKLYAANMSKQKAIIPGSSYSRKRDSITGGRDISIPLPGGRKMASSPGGTKKRRISSSTVTIGGKEVDTSMLTSLEDFGVCADPQEEFNLKTELAKLLHGTSECSGPGGVVFLIKYPRSGYTIEVKIYNPGGAYFENRCSLLSSAIKCIKTR